VAESVINNGMKVLMLVPEKSIASHLIDRCRKRIGTDKVALYHSSLKMDERLGAIESTWRGTGVVLGTRSLILAPVKDVGLIIIDEEQEPFYKQEENVRYNARELAVMRGKMQNIPVIFGSATPSLETFYNTKLGKFELITLSKTYGDAPQPDVELIDLRKEKMKIVQGVYLSSKLIDGIETTLREGKKAILLQNRRGYAPFVHCKNCGWNAKCKNCSISLTYHKNENKLICHYCSWSIPVPEICPKCGASKIGIQGAGTERLEEALKEILKDANIIRMDMDTTRKTGSHYQILKDFEKGKSNILIGTQMVAKGLDFPDVALAGIILAEVALSFPDFRSSERTFNLIYQLCGRAGRGRIKSRVFIQTFNPEHYAIKLSAERKQLEFYEQELALRKRFFYPPFSRSACITTVSKVNKEAEMAIREAFRFIKGLPSDIIIRGPSPAPIHLLKGKYRWQILLLSKKHRVLKEALIRFHNSYVAKKNAKDVRIIIDIDPLNF